MISFLMLGSLVLGLTAWVLPLVQLKNKNKGYELSVFSVVACAISLYFQIHYCNYVVNIGDISALMDTIGASSFLSGIMLSITIILNAFSIFAKRKISE